MMRPPPTVGVLRPVRGRNRAGVDRHDEGPSAPATPASRALMRMHLRREAAVEADHQHGVRLLRAARSARGLDARRARRASGTAASRRTRACPRPSACMHELGMAVVARGDRPPRRSRGSASSARSIGGRLLRSRTCARRARRSRRAADASAAQPRTGGLERRDQHRGRVVARADDAHAARSVARRVAPACRHAARPCARCARSSALRFGRGYSSRMPSEARLPPTSVVGAAAPRRSRSGARSSGATSSRPSASMSSTASKLRCSVQRTKPTG